MAVKTNDEINKQAFLNQFKSQVIDPATANAYGTNRMPIFSGTAGGNGKKTWINPVAINVSQLDPTTSFQLPVITQEEIQANDVYNTIKNYAQKLNQIRQFTSNWYYQTQDTLALVKSFSGKAVFKSTIPGLPTYSSATKADGGNGWNRTLQNVGGNVTQAINMQNPTITYTQTMTQDQEIQAAQIIDNPTAFFNQVFTKWQERSAWAVNYTYYTCHNNCHNQHNQSSRSRR